MSKSISKESKQPTLIYVRECHTVSPNHAEAQEIIVIAERYGNREDVELVFTPEDWLDTFTPTMYQYVKDNYIKHLTEKK